MPIPSFWTALGISLALVLGVFVLPLPAVTDDDGGIQGAPEKIGSMYLPQGA